MRMEFRVLAAGFALAATIVPARADPNWSGPGYYNAIQSGPVLVLLFGPYSTADECKSDPRAGNDPSCIYYASDPTPDDK